jgi:hypothetical protein
LNDPCLEIDWDGDGHTELDGDCDDDNELVHPAAVEVCDGIDNDCDELADEVGSDGATTWYLDSDNDGYGTAFMPLVICTPPDGYVELDTDCDDGDPMRHPGMEEVWYDGVDADCSDTSDFDQDLDGFEHIDHGGLDCDDSDFFVNPTAADSWYDGVDSDCGGEDDYDADGDGYASSDYGGLDCEDDDAAVSPVTPEYWNGIDDNCVGGVDNFMVMGFSTLVVAADAAVKLGHENGITAGDFDDDGLSDLVIAAERGGYAEEGAAYLLDGSTPWTLIGTPASVSEAQFSGAAAGNWMGQMGAFQRDHIGSSSTDLVIGGTDVVGGYAMCLLDGDTLSGPVGCTDASVRWTGSGDDYARIVSHLDLDGDGLPELVYGDSWYGPSDTGRVYAFNGADLTPGDFNLMMDTDWRVDGMHAYDYVGSQLGGGDLNDDGYDDLLIGAYGDDHPEPKTGSIFVMNGGSGTPPPVRTAQFDKDIQIYGETLFAQVGRWNAGSVADVNSDGANDLVVSSPGTESVHVFYTGSTLGGGSHETIDADMQFTGTDEASGFGIGLALGDLDDDGAVDIVIGAPDEEYPGAGMADSEGQVYIYFGREIETSSLTAADAGAHFSGRQDGDNFGALIRSGFDMNADGREDLAISAPGDNPTMPGGGQVHILMMPPGR